MRYKVAAAAGYLALMAGFIWEIVDVPGTYSDSAILAVLLGPQFAVGFAIGRWWALLLPAAVVLILLPAGWSDAEIPVLAGVLISAVFALPLAALGVIVRLLLGRAGITRVASGSRHAPGTGPHAV